MVNLINEFESEQMAALGAKNFPAFKAGDTIKVHVKISDEAESERTQAYEGLCIAKSKGGLNANFTVRKISYGEGVERTFHLYSPRIVSIDLIKRGKVRRGKLYYMRGLRGKAARLETISDTTKSIGTSEPAAPTPEQSAV